MVVQENDGIEMDKTNDAMFDGVNARITTTNAITERKSKLIECC